MTPANFPYEVARSATLVLTDPPGGGNGTTISPTGSFQVYELVNLVTSETRTLTAPVKSAMFFDLMLVAQTSTYTIAVTTKDSAGNNSVTYTFKTLGSVLMLKSIGTSWNQTTGLRTFAWVPYFSNI